jgi:hypothetical protein
MDVTALLGVIIGWTVAIFVICLEILILFFIFIGTAKIGWKWDTETKSWINKRGIDLEKLISEENGDASMSRFQLLIFTLVISLSLLLTIVSNKPFAFPKEIPNQILALLGISGGSYVLSKAVQSAKETIRSGSAEGETDSSQNQTNGTTNSNADG